VARLLRPWSGPASYACTPHPPPTPATGRDLPTRHLGDARRRRQLLGSQTNGGSRKVSAPGATHGQHGADKACGRVPRHNKSARMSLSTRLRTRSWRSTPASLAATFHEKIHGCPNPTGRHLSSLRQPPRRSVNPAEPSGPVDSSSVSRLPSSLSASSSAS